MKVFISRDLSADSVFHTLLAAQGWQVEARSLVRLTPLPFALPPTPPNWIFLASSPAVAFFFQKMPPPAGVRYAAIGPATAAMLGRFVPEIHFIGNGDPAAVADAFRPLALGQTVLFPAARQSAGTIARLLGDAVTALQLPIYDNQPVPDAPTTDADVLVFTSPLNAQAYFSKNARQEDQRVVAIGATTGAALAEWGIREMVVAEEASERGLAAAVLGLRG